MKTKYHIEKAFEKSNVSWDEFEVKFLELVEEVRGGRAVLELTSEKEMEQMADEHYTPLPTDKFDPFTPVAEIL